MNVSLVICVHPVTRDSDRRVSLPSAPKYAEIRPQLLMTMDK